MKYGNVTGHDAGQTQDQLFDRPQDQAETNRCRVLLQNYSL